MTASLRPLATAFAAALLAGCAATGPTARVPPGSDIESIALPSDDAYAAEPLPAEAMAPADPAYATGREVFERLRARLRTPACVDSARARQWQDRYAHHPTVFARKLEGVLPLLDFVVAETERSGLPGEFVFIPLVESWYEPGAVGRNGPTGMWQMIGTTARNHGVGMRNGYDGRLSPVDSTRAALSYLKALDAMFDGDWQATVMAYNAGEYRLAGALRRSGGRRVSAAEGVPAGLSHITYDYVSKLQALSCLVAHPERHRLVLPEGAKFRRLAPVLVDRGLHSLDQVAARTQVPAEHLRSWNPAYRGGRIVDGAPRVLLLPAEVASRVADGATAGSAPATAASVPAASGAGPATPAEPTDDAPASTTHQVRSGDTLSHIAQQYGLTLALLRRLNRLGNSNRIRPGQVLRLVP
jgi:membrane-bound lytic murein transglycosylase D